jgi:hypothetical protein
MGCSIKQPGAKFGNYSKTSEGREEAEVFIAQA